MRSEKGIVYSMGVCMSALALLSYSIAYSAQNGSDDKVQKMIEIEAVKTTSNNLNHLVVKILRDCLNPDIIQDDEHLSIGSEVPKNLSIYRQEIRRLDRFIQEFDQDTSITTSETPTISLSDGVELIYETDSIQHITLPINTQEIHLVAQMNENLTGLNITYPAGSIRFQLSLQSRYQRYDKSIFLDPQNISRIGFDQAAIGFQIQNHTLTIRNAYDRTLSYELNISFNQSRYQMPAKLNTQISTAKGSTEKTSKVMIA